METKKIAFLLYPGLTMLDLIGPLQVFSNVPEPYQAVVVGETTQSVGVSRGIINFAAPYTLQDVPQPVGIIVPGGGRPTLEAMANRTIRDYLLSNVETVEFIGSVCTGSLILAAAGLLEGRQATTHWGYRHVLEKFGATYQRTRWVEDGKFITAAGVSAGIDMGLFLMSRLFNEEQARRVQLGIEYDPDPPFGRIDWTGVEEQIIPIEQWPEDQVALYREAWAAMPELFEKLQH